MEIRGLSICRSPVEGFCPWPLPREVAESRRPVAVGVPGESLLAVRKPGSGADARVARKPLLYSVLEGGGAVGLFDVERVAAEADVGVVADAEEFADAQEVGKEGGVASKDHLASEAVDRQRRSLPAGAA